MFHRLFEFRGRNVIERCQGNLFSASVGIGARVSRFGFRHKTQLGGQNLRLRSQYRAKDKNGNS